MFQVWVFTSGYLTWPLNMVFYTEIYHWKWGIFHSYLNQPDFTAIWGPLLPHWDPGGVATPAAARSPARYTERACELGGGTTHGGGLHLQGECWAHLGTMCLKLHLFIFSKSVFIMIVLVWGYYNLDFEMRSVHAIFVYGCSISK